MAEADRVDPNDTRFFSGSSNPALAAAIAQYLRIPLEPIRVRRFSNDSLYVQLGASVRSRVVFVVQSFSWPVNDHIIELFMMLDIARSAGAREVHAIIPYFCFARSDKKDAPRISITGRLMARLLESAGATHVMTMSLHAPQVHGFFDLPTDPITSRPVFEDHFRKQDLSQTIVVAPDAGRVRSASRFANDLGLPVAVGVKTRISDREVQLTGLIGELADMRRAIIYDEEIASGATTQAMVELLGQRGIESIAAVCTHGVFADNALERLAALPQLTEIVTTDTVPIPENKRVSKLHVLSVAPLFGEAIRRNYLRQSIGDLFTFWEEFRAED
jgi:ribose-phosphate pyrophosphokinase